MNKKSFVVTGTLRTHTSLVLLIWLCPLILCSDRVLTALALGISIIIMLVLSNALLSLLSGFLPKGLHVPVYAALNALFASLCISALGAISPSLADALRYLLPTAAVCSILLFMYVPFAAENRISASIADALTVGSAFLCAALPLALLREFLGHGSILGFRLFEGAALLAMPIGGLLVTGLAIAALRAKKNKKSKEGEKDVIR